ncbi:ATP-binding protein [Natrinema sp. HArc-T2]|uniref:PAS domain-containing sensor histidine kinase n=1 Tax=Natrinema sp. HArc-T2 TaxID=3242701 RepID=UPI00359D2AD1
MTNSRSVVTAGFDAQPAHVAILDDEGEIVYTNESWNAFGDEQGLPKDAGRVGANYLAACETSKDNTATETAAEIQAVIDGDREEFSLEYPCHTPERDRWFMMRAAPYDHAGEQFVLVMHVDITERHRLEQRTREQAARMEGFAKLLSHDLRNPLSVALAEAEALEHDDEVDLGTDAGSRSTLRSSLERMASIIDDALALVTIDEVAESERSLLSLERAVEDAWEHVHTESATIAIVGTVSIHANESLVSHLFENLFRNAVEHGGHDVTVEVGPLTDGTDDRTVLEGFYIEDDGLGIPPDRRERVFESGYSVDSSGADNSGQTQSAQNTESGSGFGLAIVREVADAHGWSVSVTEGEDGGARFEIRGVSMCDLYRNN